MSFPSVTLLDSFHRASEIPLSNGGKWAEIKGAANIGATDETVGEGGSYRSRSSKAEGYNGAYWTVTQYAEPGVAIKATKMPTINGSAFELWGCLQNPTGVVKGYRSNVIREGLEKYEFLLQRAEGGTFTELTKTTGIKVAIGDKMGLQVSGGKILSWVKHGAEAWEIVNQAADSMYTEGYTGIGSLGERECYFDNFEVGISKRESENFSAILSFKGTLTPKIVSSKPNTLGMIIG